MTSESDPAFDDFTLGDLEAKGWITDLVAADYEKYFGAQWRDVSLREAAEASGAMNASADQDVASWMEQERFLEAVRRRVEAKEPMNDATYSAAVNDLYGDHPPRAALEAVFAVVDRITRRKRGETIE